MRQRRAGRCRSADDVERRGVPLEPRHMQQRIAGVLRVVHNAVCAVRDREYDMARQSNYVYRRSSIIDVNERIL